MAWLGTFSTYASTAMTIGSAIGQGKAQEQMADIQARQLERQATADKADAIRTAKHERLRADRLQSRVRALAAKSGSSLSSGDIQNTLSDIDEQGEYNALAALYSGYSSAESKKYAATAAKSQGKQAASSGYMKGGATILGEVQNRYA